MSMKYFIRHKRSIIRLTTAPLLMFLIDVPSTAMPLVQEKPQVQNVSLEIREESAIITYDLVAQIGETYEIAATLVKEGDLSFRIPVKSATGDIGKGAFAGTRRQIQWDWKKDLPKDFAGGAGYSIEIIATQAEEGGGSWLYYVLGGAVVAGGVFALAGGKHSDAAVQQTSGPITLPTPPNKP